MHRLLGETGPQDTFLHPHNPETTTQLDLAWEGLTKGERGESTTVQTRSGRKVDVPLAADGVARFTFDELCNKPLGASDYMVIAKAFHTVIVDDIPQMYHHLHYNECRRFILFIDQLYEHKVI
jgi:cell division protein ZapE